MCWATTNGSKLRHFYGRGNTPLAICGRVGNSKLDYTQIHLEKCEECLKKFPKVKKSKGI